MDAWRRIEKQELLRKIPGYGLLDNRRVGDFARHWPGFRPMGDRVRSMGDSVRSTGGLIRDSLPNLPIRESAPTLLPASIAALAVFIAITVAGRRDSASAIAPVNASSHVLWGDEAAEVEQVTLKHTLPGIAINLGAALWWSLVFRKLFGRTVDRRGAAAAMAGGLATAGLAYTVDYHLVPDRLTPGWEKRISNRSLLTSLAAMGIGLGLGAILSRRVQSGVR